ncbi:MAG: DUF721 domain-containing protein [Cellulomonadaceae bacterium]
MSCDEERPSDDTDWRPLRDRVELTDPAQVARDTLNRAKAAARARGLRPGAPHRTVSGTDTARTGSARDPQLFGAAMGALLRQRGWVDEVSVGGVIGRWREVVGDEIADHCEPLSFDEHTLRVGTDSTAWATQLRLLVPQLLTRLAAEVGEGVVEAVIVTGPAGPSFRKGRRTVPGRGPRDTYG